MREEDEERLAIGEVSEGNREKEREREKYKKDERKRKKRRIGATRRGGGRGGLARSMQSSPIEDALGNCMVIMPEWNRGRGVRGREECRR